MRIHIALKDGKYLVFSSNEIDIEFHSGIEGVDPCITIKTPYKMQDQSIDIIDINNIKIEQQFSNPMESYP